MAEEESKGIKFSDILKVVGGLALGSMAFGGAPMRASSAIRGAKASDVLKGAALSYPELSAPFNYRVIPVVTPSGRPNMNAQLDRNLAFRYPLAQTLEEHNRAVANGTENQLESWWPTQDTKPRADFHPSSSAVKGVRIDPTDNSIEIQWITDKNGKWYSYGPFKDPRAASEAAKELLTAPSIGRALPRNGMLKHYGTGTKGTPDANIGWWGRRYFNPSKARR